MEARAQGGRRVILITRNGRRPTPSATVGCRAMSPTGPANPPSWTPARSTSTALTRTPGPTPGSLGRHPDRDPTVRHGEGTRSRQTFIPRRGPVSFPVSFAGVRAGPPRAVKPVDLQFCTRQTPLNTRVQTWKACWVHALAGSNPVSSALDQAKRRAAFAGHPAFRRSRPESGVLPRNPPVVQPLVQVAGHAAFRPFRRPRCEISSRDCRRNSSVHRELRAGLGAARCSGRASLHPKPRPPVPERPAVARKPL